MSNSTPSSTAPALSSSICALKSLNHPSKSPIIASPSARHLHAQIPLHPHPALLSSCHHFHSHPNLDSSHYYNHLPLASNSATTIHGATGCSGIVCDSFSSHSISTDSHCYTTDCSPRSVIRPVHSSSSGPSPPDLRRPSSLSTHCIRNARTPRSKSHCLVSSSINGSHQPANPGKHGISSLHGQHKQTMMQKQLPCSAVERSYPMSGLDATHSHHEAETDEVNYQDILKVRSRPKLAHQGGLNSQREGQRQPGYSCGLAAVDKPCVNIAVKEANGCTSEFNQATAMEARLRSDTEKHFASDSQLHRYNRAPVALSDPSSKSMQLQSVDQRESIPQHTSYSCNLLNIVGGQCTSSMQSPRQAAHNHQTTTSSNKFSPKSPDALCDGVPKHEYSPTTKSCMQFGSKWEDAEKWLRPVDHHHHHHHAIGCRGLIPRFGLLRMSDCMNVGTAIRPHCMNHVPVNATGTANYVAAHANCALPPLINCTIHSFNAPFDSGTSSHADWRSVVEQADIAVNHPTFATRQFQHADCFHPHVISCDPNTPYANKYSLAPHIATHAQIVSRQNSASSQQSQVIAGIQKSSQAQQLHQYENSGPCMLPSTASTELRLATKHNYRELNWDEKNHGRILSLPHLGSIQHCITDPQLADRFASGECMQSSSHQLYHSKVNEKTIMMGPGIPMVSLREVGTQMSSVDGSGSISRYTSNTGSPQKIVSPARHTTPARGRSLSSSASNSGNVKRNAKQFINLAEIVECHRAKLELQGLSDGIRINSLNRTTSNWSSREVEEADLSRSLRHSTPELENPSTAGYSHQWPSQSYSWNKDDDAKLAWLQLKEAQIQAWEDKKKSKADAKLKSLEENLAKKRSQTTTKVMGSLAAAQKKAEEMRAALYAQQRRPNKKGYRLRPRSLSPVLRCTCLSVLQ
ncbi:hypothetical protein L7F22_065114 [Adiantum nelumboides]|nr:hypothetical protein [Adiantum nelumboides]